MYYALFINTGELQLMLGLFSKAATCLPPAALTWGDGSSQLPSSFAAAAAPSSSIDGNMEFLSKKPPSKCNEALKHKKAVRKRLHEGGGDTQAAARPSVLLGSDTGRNSPPSIGVNLMNHQFSIGLPTSKGMEGFLGVDSIPLCFASPTLTNMLSITSPYMFPPLLTTCNSAGKVGGSHLHIVSTFHEVFQNKNHCLTPSN